ncbi:MAG: LPS export ABC transporter permease LptG [Rhodocyclaceae bacterium]
MRTIRRYLSREILSATGLLLAALLALFAFFDLVGELNDVGKGGYDLGHALAYVALTLPGHAYEVFPIAVLIGTLYALNQLARHSEITVLRTSGLSTLALLRLLAGIGTLFVVLTFVIGEFLAPPAEQAAKRLRLGAQAAVVGQELRSGLWMKDGDTFINVRMVLPDARLIGVRIYEFDRELALRSVADAERAEFRPPASWRLTGVVRTVFSDNGAAVERLPELDWRSTLNPEILSVLLVLPERMALARLYAYIRHLSENRQDAGRYQIAFWKKLVYPLAAWVMMALAVPFAFRQHRAGGVSIRIFGGIMIGIFFHMLNGLFSNLGIINAWPPAVSAITPSAIFLFAASLMLWWEERR